MKRDLTIDIAKGIGILLVVLGHTTNSSTYIFKLIYSFHMPLFFFISGYLFSEKSTFKYFANKKVKSLLIPFVVMTLIHKVLFEETTNQFLPIYGIEWFLIVLFICYFGMYAIIKVKKIFQYLIIILLLLIHYFYYINTINCLWSIPFGLLFIYIGYMYKSYKDKINLTYSINIISLFLLLFLCNKSNLLLWKGSFSPFVFCLFTSMSGILLTYSFSNYIVKSNKYLISLLSYSGRNSLIIMLTHGLFINNPYRILHNPDNPYMFIICFIYASLCSLLCCRIYQYIKNKLLLK